MGSGTKHLYFSTIIKGRSAVAELDVMPGQLCLVKMDYKFDVVYGSKCKMEKTEEAEGGKRVEKTTLLISTYK
jgi:hypothetical protein